MQSALWDFMKSVYFSLKIMVTTTVLEHWNYMGILGFSKVNTSSKAVNGQWEIFWTAETRQGDTFS